MIALKEKYRSEIVPKLQSELGLNNVMAVPRISKITLNMGVGEAVGDKKILIVLLECLNLILIFILIFLA